MDIVGRSYMLNTSGSSRVNGIKDNYFEQSSRQHVTKWPAELWQLLACFQPLANSPEQSYQQQYLK